MKPTKELIARVIEAHLAWLQDFMANGTTRTPQEIIDDHDCKLGTFLSSMPVELRGEATYRETRRLHTAFHYYCSVLVALHELAIPIHENLLTKIRQSSQALQESLLRWEV